MDSDSWRSKTRADLIKHSTTGNDETIDDVLCGIDHAIYWFTLSEQHESLFLFDEFTNGGHSKQDTGQLRRDAAEISKIITRLESLIHFTAAGQATTKGIGSDLQESSSQWLCAIASNARQISRSIDTRGGRNKSSVTRRRRQLVKDVALACDKIGFPIGTGKTGPFPNLISDIYDRLGVELDDVSNDIRAVKRTLRKNSR